LDGRVGGGQPVGGSSAESECEAGATREGWRDFEGAQGARSRCPPRGWGTSESHSRSLFYGYHIL